MSQYQIPLKGLSCGKCVKKLTEAIESLAETEILAVDKHHLSLTTPHRLEVVISEIEKLGYQAGNHIELTLSGLKCGKCVAKVQEYFETMAGVAQFEVSKTSLSVTTTLSEDEIIDTIEKLGFTASKQAITPIKPATLLESEQQTCQNKINTNSDSLSTEALPQHSESSSAINLVLNGMTCASCVSSVEKACLSVDGVIKAQINLAEQSAVVMVQNEDAHVQQALLLAIEKAGYGADILNQEQNQQQALQAAHIESQAQYKRSAFSALIVGTPLMVWGLFGGNMMIRNGSDQLAWGVVGLLCLLLLSTAGKSFFANALLSLRHKRATMDTLVALGTGAAWLYSMLVVLLPNWFPTESRHVYFEASAMIIGLISLGHYIEAKAKLRTTESLQALIGLQAKFATVRIEGNDKKVAIELVEKGMHLVIKPGEKIPVDGVVLEGESYIDEAMLTGEPIPKLKAVGDSVSAGTINTDGSLLITATGVGKHTILARIIQMVRQAQSSKPAIAKLADTVSAVFVPIVVAIAAFAAMVWWAVGPEPKVSYMMVVATTVLIIACPCALGLATPLSVTVGVGKAAEMGILIKDADVLQTASKVDTVVFDKTGTLTLGKPVVKELIPFNQADEDYILKVTNALERYSEHPLANAICQYASEKGISLLDAQEIQNHRGKGIAGHVQGDKILVGSIAFLQQQGVSIEPDMTEVYEKQARTVIAVASNHTLIGMFTISDPIKKESIQAVSALKKNNITVVMLSGDNQYVAQKTAHELGITEVIANVLPDEKSNHISRLQQQGRVVAMVGDGINDAPALAKADIGIAMGSGSDVAIESAQMTLLNSSPVAVNNAIELSKATVKNMKQNLFGAFIYNTIGIPVAAGILYPAFGFLLSPVIAGAAMAMSSITVVSNANRLRLFKIKKKVFNDNSN